MKVFQILVPNSPLEAFYSGGHRSKEPAALLGCLSSGLCLIASPRPVGSSLLCMLGQHQAGQAHHDTILIPVPVFSLSDSPARPKPTSQADWQPASYQVHHTEACTHTWLLTPPASGQPSTQSCPPGPGCICQPNTFLLNWEGFDHCSPFFLMTFQAIVFTDSMYMREAHILYLHFKSLCLFLRPRAFFPAHSTWSTSCSQDLSPVVSDTKAETHGVPLTSAHRQNERYCQLSLRGGQHCSMDAHLLFTTVHTALRRSHEWSQIRMRIPDSSWGKMNSGPKPMQYQS